MASYATLLEKTRVPQPSIQRFAVISVFSKLRSAPERLGSESEPGREAITFCLTSASATVVDQSVRELCRLVSDSVLHLSRGLLELQSALEGCDSKLVPLFVKGLGFLIRIGYEQKDGNWKFSSTENHPFVRILSCREETQTELLHQVSLFVMHNRRLGMVGVCEFLEPFLNFTLLRIPLADSSPSLFARELISSMASLCCSCRHEALPVFRLLMRCLKYIPGKYSEDNRNFSCIVKTLVDAYTVVARDLVGTRLDVTEVHVLGVQLVDTVLLLCASPHVQNTEHEPVIESLRHLLAVQRDLGLPYSRDLSLVVLSLVFMLAKSSVEHEQLSILKLLLFLLKWKSENENLSIRDAACSSVEPLLLFPIITLMSSPSKSVKGAASKVLSIVENVLVTMSNAPKIEVHTVKGDSALSRVGSVVFRIMQQLWHQNDYAPSKSSFLRVAYINGSETQETYPGPVTWNSLLREHAERFYDRKKLSASFCLSQEIPILLGAIAGVLVMHPSQGPDAIDSLTAVGGIDPKMSVPLLLVVLYYSNLLSRTDVPCQSLLSKLLGLLPSLAAQQVMIPLVVQTITPMLHKDAKGTRFLPLLIGKRVAFVNIYRLLYATAIRLLCQTWVVNDRAFSSLQEVLRPKGFIDFMSERHICISMAASIEDVCKRHPDRGVDLILSVQACIESQDCAVRALGFQSLSHLCEADVIDFYTAWGVIEKHAQNIKLDPRLAHSACLLLKWGAMDAEAYPEAEKVLNILWEIGSSMQVPNNLQWTKARVSALMALGQYEVTFLEKQISDFNKKCAYLLFSETNAKILDAIEDLSMKIMIHEHNVRRRFVREKKVPGSKIEKLLDVIPQVIFPAGKRIKIGDLPGAALLCLSFSPKDVKFGSSRSYHDIHGQYEEAFKVVVKSLQLSRNIALALISLQSLKAFMWRWMRANIMSIDAMAKELSSDKTFKAANNIVKSLVYMAEETLPRCAENIALALGALCAVLPAAAHNIKATASKFLLGWLLEHEHEHRQWTAGVSLGLISSSLHVTDHKQKFQNISGLLEVLCSSKSTLVKGACGVGLGFSCQDLLTRTEASTSSDIDSESYRNQEEGFLGRIVTLLSSILHYFLRTQCDSLESLSALFPPGKEDNVTGLPHLLDENSDDFDDETWGIAGLIIGLGMSVGAIYRAGKKDAVVKIKNLIVSWIPYADSLKKTGGSSSSNISVRVFSAGSCLALPIVITFCQKMELFDAHEVDHLINCFKDLISELLIVKKSGAFHKSLLMASCIGAGDLLGSVLNEGIHSVEVEPVKGLVELFKTCYSGLHPPVVHFGGMLGVVNVLGAGAGNLVCSHPLPRAPSSSQETKISYVSGPLLSNSYLTQQLTPVVQEIFLIAQNTKDRQLQHYAAWAISFLRNYMRSRDASSLGNEIKSDESQRVSISHNVSEHAMVMKLAQGLINPSLHLAGSSLNIGTMASALRCLSHAPRLPNLDWEATIRRLMKQETQPDVSEPGDLPKERTLREECLKFSLAHASAFDELLAFLDELSELSRFKALEQSLQSCLLCHLGDLMRMFSGSRMDKLFDDISCFVLSSDQEYNCDQKSSLRVSCWKGLSQCLEGTSFESSEYITKIEKCVELLFAVLPVASQSLKVDQMGPVKEWSEAVKCLQKSHRDWLYKFLQVSSLEPGNGNADFQSNLKKIQAKAKLARLGSIPFSELGKLKAIILNCEQSDIWDVHVEIVAALHHAEGGIKRQWLIDAVEISCVSGYPSNAIFFVGLLSSVCCEYMPFLTLDRSTVLSDMSVTVTSLLSNSNWEVVAEPFISFLWTSLERVYSFATDSDANARLNSQRIEQSERDHAPMLVKVMHHICVAFRDHLPLEKQLRLAAMAIP